jgi:hypothetical protein
MEKYELALPEKIILVLFYMIPPALVFAIIQSAVTHNRVYFGWLILLAIIAAMYFTGGIAMITVPARFREQRTVIFLHYKTYMVKNGIIAAGRYLRNYPVFTLNEENRPIRTEAIDPVRVSEIESRFLENRPAQVWINPNHPSQCCTDRGRIVATGAVELAVCGALAALIILII